MLIYIINYGSSKPIKSTAGCIDLKRVVNATKGTYCTANLRVYKIKNPTKEFFACSQKELNQY